jgi:hypothetical protein
MMRLSLTPIRAGEAGDEKRRQRWGAHVHAAGDVGTTHSRHSKVDQHQIDVLLSFQKIQRRSTAASFVNHVPEITQHSRRRFAHGVVVIKQ